MRSEVWGLTEEEEERGNVRHEEMQIQAARDLLIIFLDLVNIFWWLLFTVQKYTYGSAHVIS